MRPLIAGMVVSFTLYGLGVFWLLWGIGVFSEPPTTCASFLTQRRAQERYGAEGIGGFDVASARHLDPDGDGRVCETLPFFPTLEEIRDFKERQGESHWGMVIGTVVVALVPAYITGAILGGWFSDLAQEDQPESPAKTVSGRVDYHAYLRSQAWRDKRAAAIRRAGGRCQMCYRQGPLEVHHRTYERLGNERDEDLTVLCRSCHQLFHLQRGMPVRG